MTVLLLPGLTYGCSKTELARVRQGRVGCRVGVLGDGLRKFQDMI